MSIKWVKKSFISKCCFLIAVVLIVSFSSSYCFGLDNSKATTVVNNNTNKVIKKADFYDIKGHWAESALQPLIIKGILKGALVNGITEARPDNFITRAEFTAILVRAFGLRVAKENVKLFSDVNKKAWYYDSLLNASSNSLIEGYPDGTFRPLQPVINAHVSIILTKLKKLLDKKAGIKDNIDESWFNREIVNSLKNELKTEPKNAYMPGKKASRAEAMSALSKFIAVAEKGNGSQTQADQKKETPTDNTNNIRPRTGNDPASVNSSITGTSTTPSVPQTTPSATNPGVLGYKLTVKPGELVYYQIYAFALADLGKFDFKITYDSKKVVATSVRNGAIKNTDYVNDVDLSKADSGVVLVKSSNTSSIAQSDGTLFTVVFKAQPGATGSTDIMLASSEGSMPGLYKTDGNIIPQLTCTNGTITILN
jgi:hypothetical protein